MLKKERAATLGDPVRGVTTPYIQSFDTATAQEPSATLTSTKTRINQSPDEEAPGPQATKKEHLNFYLSKSELETGLNHSQWLSTPTEIPEEEDTSFLTQDMSLEEKRALQKTEQSIATEALHRIASLSLASSKDRLRVNIQRCIADFGRHNTDTQLPPRLTSPTVTTALETGHLPSKTPRIGPDTGSSEVQIAILTAKIRTLADFLEGRGTQDKANKRNLRLLVHRRAKLLKYLRRKEKGGPRWRNLVEVLGLTEGTWRGEISIGRDLRAVGAGS